MDAYGRNAVPLRKHSAPNVMFLNEKPRPASAVTFGSFRAPSGKSAIGLFDQPDVSSSLQHKPPPQGATSTTGPQPLLQTPPPSFRMNNRPQSSSGMRRSGDSMNQVVPMTRPSTARGGSHLPQSQKVFQKRPEVEVAFPETIEVDEKDTATPVVSPTTAATMSAGALSKDGHDRADNEEESLEELYIQQLKQEIVRLQLLTQEGLTTGTLSTAEAVIDTGPTSPGSSFNITYNSSDGGNHVPMPKGTLSRSTSHNHVSNVLAMRQTRFSLPKSLPEPIRLQLLRYNFSHDRQQLISAKRKLEQLLGESLHQVIVKHLMVEKSSSQHGHDELVELRDPESTTYDLVEEQQHTFGSASGSHGLGTSPVRMYAQAFLTVLKQSEALKTRVVALMTEKKLLGDDLQQSQRQNHKLEEQVDLFKEVLARAKESELAKVIGPQIWQRLQATWRTDADKQQHDKEQMIAQADEQARLDTLHALESQVRQLQASLEESQRKCKQLQATLDEERKISRAAINELELRIQQEQAVALQHQQAQQEEFKKEKQAVQTEISSLQTANTSLTIERDNLNKRVEALEQANHNKLVELSRLKNQADDDAASLRTSHETEKTELVCHNEHLQQQIEQLHSEKAQQSLEVERAQHALQEITREMATLRTELAQAVASVEGRETLLKQNVVRNDALQEELDRKSQLVVHQENQLQLLEAKLNRSILMQDEQARLAVEECWNQKLAAVEHALESERQTMALLKEQHRQALAREQDKAEHAMARARTVQQELEAANLCLAERKKQLDKDQRSYAEQSDALAEKLRQLAVQNDRLEAQVKFHQQQSDSNTKQLEQVRQQSARAESQSHVEIRTLTAMLTERTSQLQEALAKVKSLEEQFQTLRQHSDDTAEELEQLRRHQCSQAATPQKIPQTPRGNPSSALAEARAELQKAKAKLAAMEDHKDKCDSARSKELDTKLKALTTKERRVQEDSKALKKQRSDLVVERKQLEDARAALLQDAQVFQEVVRVLNERLTTQMTLLEIVPKQIASFKQISRLSQSSTSLSSTLGAPTTPSIRSKRPSTASAIKPSANTSTNTVNSSASLNDFLLRFQSENVDLWRNLQTKWQSLQSEMDESDWKLVELRDRLQQLVLGAAADQINHETGSDQQQGTFSSEEHKSSLRSNSSKNITDATGVSPHPFSDAIANGQSTLSVAKQLTLSLSRKTLSLHDKDGKDLEPHDGSHEETTSSLMVASLRKEMASLKESYESRVEELTKEIGKIQKLRVETCQRLRNELSDQKRDSQHLIALLNEKCTSLEARLATLQRAYYQLQDQEIELLERYADASDETFRREILHRLFELISNSCREEMALRSARRQQRLDKLQHSYCGASSVTDPREEKQSIV